MSRYLGIRITANSDSDLLLFAEQYPGIWCKEGPDLEKFCQKDHYHGLIESSLTANGLRKQIYNFFNIPKEKRGNPSVAFSTIIEDENHPFDKERINLWAISEQVCNFFNSNVKPVFVSNACISGVTSVIVGVEYLKKGKYKNVIVC